MFEVECEVRIELELGAVSDKLEVNWWRAIREIGNMLVSIQMLMKKKHVSYEEGIMLVIELKFFYVVIVDTYFYFPIASVVWFLY